jgi:hypothetical protein
MTRGRRRTRGVTSKTLNKRPSPPPGVDIDRIYQSTTLLYGGGRNGGGVLCIRRHRPRAHYDQE